MKKLLFAYNTAGETVGLSLGLLILRIGFGGTMLFSHGMGKLTGFGGMASKFADPFGLGPGLSLGLAVFAEFLCSLGIILGFMTRLATVPLIITMLTAFFIIHGDDPFSRREMALLYLVPFLTLLFTGPGRYSIDAVIGRKLKG